MEVSALVDNLKHAELLQRMDAYRRLTAVAVALGPQRAHDELLPFLRDAVRIEDDEVLVILAEQLQPDFVPLLIPPSLSSALPSSSLPSSLSPPSSLFAPATARSPNNVSILTAVLEMLEELCAAEESLVRNAAIANVRRFVQTWPASRRLVGQMFERLATGDWFTTKVSACALLQSLVVGRIEAGEEDKEEEAVTEKSMRTVAKMAFGDDSPMVRRAALPALTDVIGHLLDDGKDVGALLPPLQEALEHAARDPQDSVRLLSVPLLVTLLAGCRDPLVSCGGKGGDDPLVVPRRDLVLCHDQRGPSSKASQKAGLPICDEEGRLMASSSDMEELLSTLGRWLQILGEDMSWRVRFMVAQHLGRAPLHRLPHGHQLFRALVEDAEPEVRAALASSFDAITRSLLHRPSPSHAHSPSPDMGHWPTDPDPQLRADLLDIVMPSLRRLCRDSSVAVRAAVGPQLNALSEFAGPMLTRQELLPLLELLIGDEDSSVRLGVVAHLDVLNRVIGVRELTGSLMPAIRALAGDRQWRVRLACQQYFPVLARHLGPDAPHLMDLIVAWLVDPVYVVRTDTIQCLSKLADSFGPSWLCTSVVPAFEQLLLSLRSEGVGDSRENARINVGAGAANSVMMARSPTVPASASPSTNAMQSYLKRVSVGRAMAALDPAGTIFPDRLWLALSRDPISNVRMTVPAGVYERLRLAGSVPEEEDPEVVSIRQQISQGTLFLVTAHCHNSNSHAGNPSVSS